MTMQRFGWIPDHPDHRDLVLNLDRYQGARPAGYDMEPTMPPVYDQGNVGSCTANAGCGLVQYTEKEQVGMQKRPVPSRLFVYWNTRKAQGTEKYDSGATIRGTMKALAKWGYCGEARWPYQEAKVLKQPSDIAYRQAKPHMLQQTQYMRVPQTAEALETVLAANNPVAFGFTVYENFDKTEKGGIVPMPKGNTIGGHAVLLVGYDTKLKCFKMRNSWGASWAMKGYAWMPYEYVLNNQLADDFWTLVQVPAVDEAG
jgi:C1A family cysteine protease